MVDEIEQRTATEFALLNGAMKFIHDDSFRCERIPTVLDITTHYIRIELGMKLHPITSFRKPQRVMIIEIVLRQHRRPRR